MNYRQTLTRRAALRAVLTLAPAAAISSRATPASASRPVPAPWPRYGTPEAGGFSSRALAAIEQRLYALPTTSLMIAHAGKIVYAYGDISEVSYLASARKSVLSMLYGNYVAKGLIDLDRTLQDLGIDENDGGLLPIERTATIRALLTSRSGVYFPASSAGSASVMPPRGSSRPGTKFIYNNWDFNVAGAVFEQLTGKSIFQALQDDLAGPLAFQDFDFARQRYVSFKSAKSRYRGYQVFLSARDMARMGVAMIQNGVWDGRRIVPERWVRESTSVKVPAADVGPSSEMGYGYLWWIPTTSRHSPEWAGSFLAAGNYGQFVLGLPAMKTVIVHRRAVTDEFAVARNLGDTEAVPPGVDSQTFLQIADQVIAARTS